MFNPRSFENSGPEGFGVLEVVGDHDAEAPRRFVPLKRTELRGEVFGPLAGLRMTQVFGYTAEACERVLEAVYRFPLPGDAAVTGVRVRFGDVSIRAELADRRQAEAEYEEATRQHRQAALATRESPDVFTLRVAGIQPDQAVTVETAFVQLARPEGAGWSIRVPLTTAPRYVRGDEAGSRSTDGQPLGLLRDPGHRFVLDLEVRGTETVTSPTHRLDLSRNGDRALVRLADGEVVPDRDCVLVWHPLEERDRPKLEVTLHEDPASGQVYFLALVAPPATRDRGRGLPRDVILLVDHSGSMQGPKWQAADWAVERFLSDLTERDIFALGLFHDSTRWFDRQPRRADPGTVAAATAFLSKHRDSGGTELGVALEQALGMTRDQDNIARHVLIVTDAEVSDEGRILRLAEQESSRFDRRRVSVLCIDSAPNSYLAVALAERGGGVSRFLTSDPAEQDIATALDEVLADWAEPVSVGLRLEIDREDVRSSGRAVNPCARPGWSETDLGDLPAGRPLWVVGRAPRGEGAPLSFRLVTSQDKELASCRQDLVGESPHGRALKALFGARQVLGLEHLIDSRCSAEELRDGLRRLGYEPERVTSVAAGTVPKVYPENTHADAVAALRELLVQEALAFGLASSETAFLATRNEPGQPLEARVEVANALPHGWSEEFVGGGFRGGLAGPIAACCVDSFLLAGPPHDSSVPGGFYLGQPAVHDVFDGDCPANDLCEVPDLLEPADCPPPRSGQLPGTSRSKSDAPASNEPSSTVLFGGIPTAMGGEAILFDSEQVPCSAVLPDHAILSSLVVRFTEGMPGSDQLDAGLALLVFVGDRESPRARVRLADLVRQRGVRPLNVRRSSGEAVRIVLVDPAGAWKERGLRLEVSLGWSRD